MGSGPKGVVYSLGLKKSSRLIQPSSCRQWLWVVVEEVALCQKERASAEGVGPQSPRVLSRVDILCISNFAGFVGVLSGVELMASCMGAGVLGRPFELSLGSCIPRTPHA